MERIAYRIMVLAIDNQVRAVANHLLNYGVQETLTNLEGIVSRNAINAAYAELYYAVGQKHKEWTDADVAERFPARKSMQLKDEEDDRLRRRRPNPANIQVETGFEVGFFNSQWLARLKGIVNNIDVIERVNSVKSTIIKSMRKSISDAQQQFVSIRKITARFRQDFNRITPVQAQRVVRTEVTYVNNIAAEQSSVETGLELKKIWIHTLDTRTRDTHRSVSAKPIDSNGKFKVGGKLMDRPGDPNGGLSEIINCRCSVAYIPADDYEDLLDSQGNFIGLN